MSLVSIKISRQGIEISTGEKSSVKRALLVSKIFHPLWMAPLLALFFLLKSGTGFFNSLYWISLWVFVALLPTALITYFTGKRKLNIESGRARRRGYITGISAVIASILLTWHLSAPEPVFNLGLTGILSAVAFGTANHFDKVSVHTGALTGFSGIFVAVSPVLSGSIAALAVVVGWSRVELDMHSRREVIGGAVIGVFCGLTVVLL
jgi:membrane-associated phospholipid phosphatase